MQVNFSHKALAFAEQIAHGSNSKNEIFIRKQIFFNISAHKNSGTRTRLT